MVVSSRLREATALGAGVEQREAAGAVGRFHHAGREAALPDRSPPAGRRRCRGCGSAPPNSSGAVAPKSPAQSRTSGSSAARHAEQPAAARRPSAPLPMSNSSVRAALVASVACTLPPVSRHSRKLSTVPKASSPASAAVARAGDVVEQPGDLGGGEIRIEQQPGLGRRSPARGRRARSVVAGVGGAAVLPDDGVVDRLAGRAVPDDRGLALVGDADGGDVLRREPGLGHRRAHGRDRRASRCPPGRARPSRAPDRSGGAPAARTASGASAASNTMARVEVVPWSMAMRAAGKTVSAARRRFARTARKARSGTGAKSRSRLVHQHQLGDRARRCRRGCRSPACAAPGRNNRRS